MAWERCASLGRPPAFALEQILEYDPPHHLAYTIVRGIPVRGYHADVDLVPTDGGTAIRWAGAFEPKIPGTGALFAASGRIVHGYAKSAAAEAERRLPRSVTGTRLVGWTRCGSGGRSGSCSSSSAWSGSSRASA